MSLLDPPRSETPTSTAVVAVAVVVFDGEGLPETFAALARQVYEPAALFVVGGGDSARERADEYGAGWVGRFRDLLGALPGETTHVWLIHDDVRPRPDALAALVRESGRIEASVAGSKVLRADRPEVLESVGAATDVFAAPYSGLDEDEVDQQQYDVIRDVAFVSSASVLVRRDLLRGLGGPDLRLPPEASSIDFCQRARLAGGRVVVVPSSEVLHGGACAATVPAWREEAGRVRAVLKAYRPLTLAWVLPLALLISLIRAAVLPFLGRRSAPSEFLRVWGWNLGRLGGTRRLRSQARRSRLAGDEELFRFQSRGSVELRGLAREVMERARRRTEQGTPRSLGGLVELGQEALHHPVAASVAVSALFVAVATRGVWAGALPVAGYALPPAEGARSVLAAYAGGWNVAGLGSPEPLRPAVGAVALVQMLLLDRPGLTAALLTVGGLAAGILGTARLLRRFGVGPYARYAAGLVLVAGPASRAMAGEGSWPGLLALGALPWAVAFCLTPWPKGWRRRVGRLGVLGLLNGWMAAFAPIMAAVPVGALALWAVLGDRYRRAVLPALAGGLLAVPLLFPWLYVADPVAFLGAGLPAFWEPSLWTLGLVGVVVVALLSAADPPMLALGGWGAVTAGLGAVLARSGSLGVGHEVGVPGLALTALGLAVLVGAALTTAGRMPEELRSRRMTAWVGAVGAAVLVAASLLVVPGGRAGLPEDQFRDPLRFVASRQLDQGSSRVLLLGPAGSLPGDARVVEGAAYRVVSAPHPTLWEAWLPAPRLGDRELERVLVRLAGGETTRVGEELAPFGVRWVVLTGETPFEEPLAVQLDLQTLPGFAYPAFQSEVEAPRAVTEGGTPWEWAGPDYRGPARSGDRVYLAENGDRRWGPGPWEQAGWGNRVSAEAGVASFAGVPAFRIMAAGSGALLVLLLAAAWWGRRGS